MEMAVEHSNFKWALQKAREHTAQEEPSSTKGPVFLHVLQVKMIQICRDVTNVVAHVL
jgi:hypothetical protein